MELIELTNDKSSWPTNNGPVWLRTTKGDFILGRCFLSADGRLVGEALRFDYNDDIDILSDVTHWSKIESPIDHSIDAKIWHHPYTVQDLEGDGWEFIRDNKNVLIRKSIKRQDDVLSVDICYKDQKYVMMVASDLEYEYSDCIPFPMKSFEWALRAATTVLRW